VVPLNLTRCGCIRNGSGLPRLTLPIRLDAALLAFHSGIPQNKHGQSTAILAIAKKNFSFKNAWAFCCLAASDRLAR